MRWLHVVGYEGMYEVSEDGQVRSIPRTVGYRIKGMTKRMGGRILRQKLDRFGYLNVCLSKKNRQEFPRVHVLVAIAFHGQRPTGLAAAHLDGDKKNNHASNLRWVTHAENESHKKLHGTMPTRDWHGRFVKITK